ncbi:MAG: FkbM family methyltransferase [Verrucomicrobiota bacterium]
MNTPEPLPHLSIKLGKLLTRIRPAPLGAFLKRILCIRRFVFESKEGKFFVDPASNFGLRLIENGEYEPGTTRQLHQLLKPGGVFIDLGANEGYYSIIAGRIVGMKGRVIGIEPQSRLQEVLRKNRSLNELENLEFASCAISDKEETSEIYLLPDLNTSGSSMAQITRYRNETESIQTKRLVTLLGELNIEQVDLIKIDIEGWEWEAVMGSPELFRSGKIKHILLELHNHILEQRGFDYRELESLLQDAGYQRNPDFHEHWILQEPGSPLT